MEGISTKNTGLQIMKLINDSSHILCVKGFEQILKPTPQQLLTHKYVLLVSVHVESNFSLYKRTLKDHGRNCCPNLSVHRLSPNISEPKFLVGHYTSSRLHVHN